MIKFDTNKLSVEIVQLKTITTALGGSMSVVDDKKSTETKEVLKRVPVPLAVARDFIIRTHKVTRYLKPVYVAVAKYGNHVVALERHPLAGLGELESDGLFGKRRWVPNCETNVNVGVKTMVRDSGHAWYFDGRYAYSFDGMSVERAIGEGFELTTDGKFRKVPASTIDLQCLFDEGVVTETRSCMAFGSASGDMAVSPPIWKNLSEIGSSKMKKSAETDSEEDEDEDVEIVENNAYTFDNVNNMFAVNLNFALKAGSEIGQTFGYDHVEPLQLPRLMIELHTTNLPNVRKSIKATHNIGMSFTHVMAWLLGMSRKANTLETFVMMRSLMKYLTTKGLFVADKLNPTFVFQNGRTAADIPLLDMSEFTSGSDRVLADAKVKSGPNQTK